MNEEKIRELIAVIDSFHGNQLKDKVYLSGCHNQQLLGENNVRQKKMR